MMQPQFVNPFLTAVDSTLPSELESEIRAIYRSAPLYPSRLKLHEEPLEWGCYLDLPPLTKQEIIDKGPSVFFPDGVYNLHHPDYEYEHTSGTTNRPMTVIMERGWWERQAVRAYQASPILRTFVDKPHRRAVLAPVGCSSNLCPYEDEPFPHRYQNDTIFLNLSSDPFSFSEREWDRIVVELQAVKPVVLEGEPTYLSLLARAVQHRKVSIPSLQAVILTYGPSTVQHRRRIGAAFPAPQVDLYGSTEAGYLLVGEAGKDNMRVIEDNAFVELEPWKEGADIFKMRVTTRGRKIMPLLRYETGDLVQRTSMGYRILGREGNVWKREDGSVFSSWDADQALPQDFACWHYLLSQTSPDRWDFQ